MDDLDAQVRLAAFAFLEEQVRLGPEDGALPRELLTRGFTYQGERVPLVGPQGCFKPRRLREMPLSITTVALVEGDTRLYDMHSSQTVFCAIGIAAPIQNIMRTSA